MHGGLLVYFYCLVANVQLIEIHVVHLFFVLGHYDKCVAALREKFKDDMSTVTGTIFSHSQVQKKNALIIMLIVSTTV